MARRAMALGLLLPLAACSPGPVHVAAPRGSDTCTRLHAALPATVAGQDRRPTDPERATVAAWGDPAIVLRCGVARPRTLTQTSEVTTASPLAVQPGSAQDVHWYVRTTDDGSVWTTADRSVFVEVRVPAKYGPQPAPIVDLVPAVGAVPQADPGRILPLTS